MSQLTATIPCPQCNELGTSKWDCLGELDYPTEHDAGHEGAKPIKLYPAVQMGGLAPAWYPAQDDEPDGWIAVV